MMEQIRAPQPPAETLQSAPVARDINATHAILNHDNIAPETRQEAVQGPVYQGTEDGAVNIAGTKGEPPSQICC